MKTGSWSFQDRVPKLERLCKNSRMGRRLRDCRRQVERSETHQSTAYGGGTMGFASLYPSYPAFLHSLRAWERWGTPTEVRRWRAAGRCAAISVQKTRRPESRGTGPGGSGRWGRAQHTKTQVVVATPRAAEVADGSAHEVLDVVPGPAAHHTGTSRRAAPPAVTPARAIMPRKRGVGQTNGPKKKLDGAPRRGRC